MRRMGAGFVDAVELGEVWAAVEEEKVRASAERMRQNCVWACVVWWLGWGCGRMVCVLSPYAEGDGTLESFCN